MHWCLSYYSSIETIPFALQIRSVVKCFFSVVMVLFRTTSGFKTTNGILLSLSLYGHHSSLLSDMLKFGTGDIRCHGPCQLTVAVNAAACNYCQERLPTFFVLAAASSHHGSNAFCCTVPVPFFVLIGNLSDKLTQLPQARYNCAKILELLSSERGVAYTNFSKISLLHNFLCCCICVVIIFAAQLDLPLKCSCFSE